MKKWEKRREALGAVEYKAQRAARMRKSREKKRLASLAGSVSQPCVTIQTRNGVVDSGNVSQPTLPFSYHSNQASGLSSPPNNVSDFASTSYCRETVEVKKVEILVGPSNLSMPPSASYSGSAALSFPSNFSTPHSLSLSPLSSRNDDGALNCLSPLGLNPLALESPETKKGVGSDRVVQSSHPTLPYYGLPYVLSNPTPSHFPLDYNPVVQNIPEWHSDSLPAESLHGCNVVQVANVVVVNHDDVDDGAPRRKSRRLQVETHGVGMRRSERLQQQPLEPDENPKYQLKRGKWCLKFMAGECRPVLEGEDGVLGFYLATDFQSLNGVKEYTLGTLDQRCSYCRALYFEGERNT